MIEIKKTAAPPDLVELQQDAVRKGLTANEAYEKLQGKKMGFLREQVVNQLMRDQGHLCAYCMRRIPDTRDADRGFSQPLEVKIEHWDARSGATCGAFGALDYNNMLAVCSGNQNGPTRGKSKLTCDAKRGNRTLTVNPMDAGTLTTIFYTEDGIITATDKTIDDDLNIGLNLNCTKDAVLLPTERMMALNALEEVLDDEINSGADPLETYSRHYHELLEIEDEKPLYLGILLWHLKDFIEKYPANT